MEERVPRKRKRSFTRSPSYPSINLESALNLLEIIKDKEGGGQHYISYVVALEHWKYRPKSSNGLLKLAALKKFALIDDRGKGAKREIKISDLGRKILFLRSNGQDETRDYYLAVQDAALSPPIHSELWEKYHGDLPPTDQSIRTYLVINRPDGQFSENAVDDFLRQFRSTISFANLDRSDILSGEDEDKNDVQSKESAPMQSDTRKNNNKTQSTFMPNLGPSDNAQLFNIPIMFPSGKRGQMAIPYPLTDEEWSQMLGFLNAYKPSLVSKIQKAEADDEDENNFNN